ncbi:MAG: hypothetical protein LUC97_04575 [Clostridiales bacterium]|nr:hypothetical protein [Clostridiales bacterium]
MTENTQKSDNFSSLSEADRQKRYKDPKRKNIKKLFENYDGAYEASEIDWGEPTGKEFW